MNISPYTLGLDIGMASVGAALLTDSRIIALHVRANPASHSSPRVSSAALVSFDEASRDDCRGASRGFCTN